MTYKEFRRWCTDRAHDGCWGYLEALVCINIIQDMQSCPFFKRKKKWQGIESEVVETIVKPTNEKIRQVFEKEDG